MMKNPDQFLKCLFPLPKALQQLIEAEAFLLISPKDILSNRNSNYKIQLRCIEYETEKQARQNQVKFISLSNAFHLSIKSSITKYLPTKGRWCLIIEMESPQMSLKQKLNMNRNTLTYFTENQLILILHSMNVLLSRYSQPGCGQNVTPSQLLDYIFMTHNQQVKMAVPTLMYPLKMFKKNQSKLNPQVYNSSKLASFLLELITLDQQENFRSLNLLQQRISTLNFQSFPMKQFKIYLLNLLIIPSNLSTIKPNKNLNLSRNLNESDMNVSIGNSFPNMRLANSSKVIKSHHRNFSSPKQTPIRSITAQDQESQQGQNKRKVRFMTLNQITEDKVVQSFQQDEYSYVLESNNASPCRISPRKGFHALQFSKVSYQANLSRLSPVISQKIQEQLSNSFEMEIQHEQQNLSQHQNLQHSNSSANHKRSITNSMILEVQQDSNYALVEGSSAKSDIIELSFSQNNDQIEQIQEIHDESSGTKYFGQTIEGLKEGKGKMFYPDGGYYEGEWKNNQICGFGRLFYPSNKLAYAGYWKNGCFHGPGLVLNQQIETVQTFDYTDFSNLGRTWISYRGNFNMDIRQGFGLVKISNGDSIAGIWESNCLNGEAEYKKQDGSIIKGIWKMNRLEKILPQQIKN